MKSFFLLKRFGAAGLGAGQQLGSLEQRVAAEVTLVEVRAVVLFLVLVEAEVLHTVLQ